MSARTLLLAPRARTLESPGPLGALLSAVRSGARSVPELAQTTGLSRDTVTAGLEHLVRTHRLIVQDLTSSCAGRCTSCDLPCERA
ncbi:MAG: FeoC-like transcriptional regulator [Propionibacteriaceae bacterium]|jgi:hypothetical protein|nr:FeoC-like transcriptional regulator [Propionibacteriaceae bacterium]